MAPSKTGKTAKPDKPKKREKIYHPQSRKADQLNRKMTRKEKLVGQASVRVKKHHAQADIYGFFFHSLPEEGEIPLEQLHVLIRDIWLTRHDEDLAAERAERRKGRPKSVKAVKLEEIKLREEEEYRTGFEIIDLSHPPTVELFRQWDQKEVPYIDLLRFIRISSTSPETFVVSRPGKHASLLKDDSTDKDVEMGT